MQTSSRGGTHRRRTVLTGALGAATLTFAPSVFTPTAASAAPSAAPSSSTPARPTVVLVHGAFADASGWNDVIARLTRDGYPVLAPANPLRGVAGDSAYLASILATITGPIVLVGHSYGGVVITNAATDNANVKALVYIAAFAPDAGDTVEGLQTKFPGTKLGEPQLDIRPYPLPDGTYSADGYVKADVFRDIFAGDLPRATTAIMAATQRPGDVHTLRETSGAPAWKQIPSWYLVARDDNLIPAAAQRFMAQRAGSRVVEARSSHVAMMSQPRLAAELIALAARASAGQRS
ncbi:alpha/beta fold hydrolase [Dactylosporangium siamense]|uniref:Alpha/beta hydrolase n=1 Tax=Dactylosporangium siamense TaxID=685454 RepID=A0A919UEY9_9ACTN|nr:alpha/beta hydrolase [Dactylosporangium siamense]GIG48103.1 alpha/beta hydrolase [Dactylosporangium siamense]